MDADFQVVSRIFATARRLPPEERPPYLETACRSSARLRAEVEALLAAHDASPEAVADPLLPPRDGLEDFLAVSGGDDVPTPSVAGFRVLGRLAAGSMGTVYLAEQERPRRRVALKVLRAEAATAEGIRRFEREAELLARLDHPGIARVHVFGTTNGPGDPRPFLAMELVAGRPLTQPAARLSIPQRVRLLAEVCDAVAHAHAQGVIHRDLKPDNILVSEELEPKVVDFGVARLVDDDIAFRTRAGFLIGTLAYMSPEQALGESSRLDMRSDVYALGTIAYEVLCGSHPLGDASGPIPAVVQRILHEAPRDPGSFDRRLRGDLALVVLTALSKDRHRRYANAGYLAEDLRRCLRDEPILARPATGAYLLRRFLSRYRALAVGVGAVVLSLAVGLIAALGLARSEHRQRLRADRNADLARQALAHQRTASAAGALWGADAAAARAALEQVPPDLRGWEWHYLVARTDESQAHVPLDVGPLVQARLGHSPHPALVLTRAGTLHALARDGAGVRELKLPAELRQHQLAALRGAPVVVSRDAHQALVHDEHGNEILRASPASPRALQRAEASPDGRTLALVMSGGVKWCPLELLDLATGTSRGRGAASVVGTDALAFSPTRGVLFHAGWNGVIHGRLLAAPTRTPYTLRGHANAVGALAVSPDERRLASGSRDRTVCLWDLASGALLLRLGPLSAEVEAVGFAPDGATVVAGTGDGRLTEWEADDGTLRRALVGHVGRVLDVGYDDHVLESLGEDGLRRWSPTARPDLLRVCPRVDEEGNPGYVYGVAFAPDGRRLATASWDGRVRVFDAVDAREAGAFETTDARLRDVCWRRDGRALYTGHARLQCLDARTGALLTERAVPDGFERLCLVPPRGDVILAAGTSGWLRAYGTDDLEPRGHWRDGAGRRTAVAAAPDGARVATLGEAGDLVVRRLPDGALVWRATAHAPGPFGALVYSPQGRWLASGGPDRLVRIWDAASGICVRTLTGHADAVYALAFTPDGKRLFSGANDGTVLVWDPAAGTVRLRLAGHTSYVYDLAVSPGGRAVASASGDGTVRLWRAGP